ncbi:HAD family hydrolase [Staphylococcus coagulans]|uniref:HAD family hydrolase n=1 Tax=Staphylococcus coagulans TaxID=74706 RepID=UPI00397F4ADE
MMKVILFDLDDTLYNQLEAFEFAYHRHFADSDIGAETLYRHFRIYSDALFEATQLGELSLKAMHIARITQAVHDFDIDLPEHMAIAFQQDYEAAQQHINLSETMAQILDFLTSQQVELGILTNGESDRQRRKIEALNLDAFIPESHQFISAEFGLSKPELGVFKVVEQELVVDPHEIYYIGDHFDNDVIGAIDAGWHSIWFNRRNRPMTHQQYTPDHIVMTEEELFETIKTMFEIEH